MLAAPQLIQGQQIVCERIIGTGRGIGLTEFNISTAPNDTYVVTASGNSNGLASNVKTHLYLARLGSVCDTLWQRWIPHSTARYGLSGLAADAHGIWLLTPDSAYANGPKGVRLWQVSLNGQVRRLIRPTPSTFYETASSVVVAPDGGCYVSVINSIGVGGGYIAPSLMRFDSTGTMRWRQNYAGSASNYLTGLALTPTGNILLVGEGAADASLRVAVKFLEVEPGRGDSLRVTYVPTPASNVDESAGRDISRPYELIPLRQGGYAMATRIIPFNGQTPPPTGAVVRLDANYNLLWRYQYNTTSPSGPNVYFTQVRELADGSLLALARSSYFLQRTCWLYRLNGATGAVLNIYPIQPQLPGLVQVNYLLPVASDSTLLLAGPTITNAGQPAGLYVARVRIQGLPRVVSAPVVTLATTRQARAALALHCYPNPATDELHVSYALAGAAAARLEVRDMLGRVVWQQPASAGGATVPVRGLAPGLYLVALVDAGQTLATRRVAITN